MFTALERALFLADQVEEYPLGRCGPSDDPDQQTAYVYAFLDLARPFVAAVKRIGDPDLSEQVSLLDLEVDYIIEVYKLKAELQGVIDHLREVSADPTYGSSVKSNTAFLEPSVLAALRQIDSMRYDCAKLVRFCEELNDAYGRGNYLSCVLLIRAVMNHVPPVFGCRTFAELTAQSGRSLKAIFERLEDNARPIADLHTHALIRAKESLPTKHQVEPYKASFELLIQEVIVRIEALSEA
jgi:hypothetical protein